MTNNILDWYEDYSAALMYMILQNFMTNLYRLFISYVFMIIFNIPIGVICLVSILCSGIYDQTQEKNDARKLI